MTYSNLSKIKPKLRTSGRVSGNFGKSKVVAGSSLNDIGVTNAKVIKCTKQTEYLNRLYTALDSTTDEKLRRFIYTEIRQILIQTGKW
jgi:hypothetical protein